MTPKCPNCSKRLTSIEGASRSLSYTCPRCSGRFWLPSWQAVPLTLLPLFLVGFLFFLFPGALSALDRFASEQLPGDSGHLGATIAGMLLAYVGQQFVMPSLARLQRMSQTPTQVTSREVGFLRALGLDVGPIPFFHLALAYLIAVIVPLSIATIRIGLTTPTAIVMLATAALVTKLGIRLRCPSCRGNLLAQRPTAWLAMGGLRDCPFCHYTPTATSDVLETSAPTRGRTIAIACLYLVAAWLGFRILIPRPPTLPEPGAPPLRQANYDWRHADQQGRWHDAESLRGKPLVLNFMSTTSTRSRRRYPSITALAAAMGEHAIVLSLSDEPLSTLQSWVSDHPDDAALHHVEPKARNQLGLNDRPRVIIVDAAGWVRFEEGGLRNWEHATVRSYLRSLGSTTSTTANR